MECYKANKIQRHRGRNKDPNCPNLEMALHLAGPQAEVYFRMWEGLLLHIVPYMVLELPWWYSGKESACQCRRRKRCRFHPWVRKMPWEKKWQPDTVFLPGKSHGQRSLADRSQWGCKELNTTKQRSTHITHSMNNIMFSIIQFTEEKRHNDWIFLIQGWSKNYF